MASVEAETPPDVPASLEEALLAVQAALPALGLGKDAQGEVSGENKKGARFSYKYDYLSYPKLLDVVRPLLTGNELLWQTFPTTLDGRPALRYRLTFAPTKEAQEDVVLLMMDKPTSQAQGSAITYARRYALMAVLEIAPDGDDDGKAASQAGRPAPVDPEAPLPEESVAGMLEAIAERGLSAQRVLERVGVAEGSAPTIEQGRAVKALLEEHDAKAQAPA